MKNSLTRLLGIAALATLLGEHTADARITLVRNGKAKATIVCTDTLKPTRDAAILLQDFTRRISGAELPITVRPAKRHTFFSGAEILIGGTTDLASEDGYTIGCNGNCIRISSGGGKGAVYGAVALLEKQMGVRYLAREYCRFTPSTTISIEDFNASCTPAFRYRQTHSYGCEDPVYRQWFALEDPHEVFAANLWVHTFNSILPSSRFGKEHPEWYSLINGKRHPGDHSQWCLSNPEVFEAACTQIDSIFKANPGMKMISVSQNDGNDTYCTCPECSAVDEYEGAHSGSLIRFLNKLAERFPDKEFSTLAYLYSMHPPKHVKPLPNVNIMLCDIDCKREVPLTDNASGRDFVRALEGWGAISDNLFIWDYGINFDNMVSPFPNFHVLQPNLQLFHRNNATMVFEQVNGAFGTDFSELRAYLLAKLLWDPYQDLEALKTSFLEDYYGAAAPMMSEYLDLREKELLESGRDLWIYDSPVSHKDGFLRDEMMVRYDALFDEAEKAVEGDSLLLAHVQISRLQQQYSELEIARTGHGHDVTALLDTFEKRTAKYGVTQLNERHNSPADYCVLYRERFLGSYNGLPGATVDYANPPAPRYRPIADKALTDGLYGGTTYVESWIGWEGEDADFTIDLGAETTVCSVSTDFLHQLGAWILLPKGGCYQTSIDGVNWEELGCFSFAEDRDLAVKFVKGTATGSPRQARYIRVHVDTLGECPSWHYGVGHPAWFFIDEVTVND